MPAVCPPLHCQWAHRIYRHHHIEVLEKNKADVFKVCARDLDDLIGAFEEAFEEGDMETPDCAWGCLISCYYEVMKAVEGAIIFVPRTMVCDDVNTIYSICLLISEKWTDYKRRLMSTMPN